MVDTKRAIKEGTKGAALECFKSVPVLSVLIEGVKNYQASIETQQKELFLELLRDRVAALEKVENIEWFKTTEGEEVVKKIVASALNAEYGDKIEYFANALVNCAGDFEQAKRLKFIETLRHVSKPALCILAEESELQQKRGKHFSPQVLVSELIERSGKEPHLVDACVKELGYLGVFSSTVSYTKDGKQEQGFSSNTLAYTEFTERFVEFIKNPMIDIEKFSI